MSKPLGLIVTDASPLITLAMAGALDLLTQTNTEVRVPDAVYEEATRLPRAGAEQIKDWIANAPPNVKLIPTNVGLDQRERLQAGHPIKNMGELAALEVAIGYLKQHPDQGAILLYEDSDVLRIVPTNPAIMPVSTRDFLSALERAQMIQSADRIIDQAKAGGRNLEQIGAAELSASERTTLELQLAERRTQEISRGR